ncbi:MAG TPA: alpha/beta hydrolase [Candidatus Sulfotelmatobacter sp.]|nr:alpha/beta hydrolase [Candidatus Sulfotelmatobacter sp.]
MPPSHEGFIEAEEDVRLYFRSLGEGEAVLIPLASWTEEFDVLAEGRRLIFYDPRNRGQSTAVALERISFQNDVRDLEAVRNYFGLPMVSLIGWSYFGGVVARYAMEFPEHVQRFVMVCGPPIRRSPHSEAVNRVMAERINAVAPGFLQELQASLSPSPNMLQKLWELLREVRKGNNPLRPMRGNPSQFPNESPEKVSAVFQRAMQTQGDWDWCEDAKRATSPALFVFGTADFLPLEAAREWAEYLPNAQVFTMDGVGHFPSLEDPDRFFSALDAFLHGHWPQP